MSRTWAAGLCLLFFFVPACGEDAPRGARTESSPAEPAGPVAIPDCGIGTMALAGATTCAPVGPAVPAGFEAAPDDWGFRAILPSRQCTPATRLAIGERDCVPVDDCARPFPPPEAKVVVRQGSGPTLEDAIASASKGDTIAIDRGTYGAVRIARDVTLVGRCAREVALEAKSADEDGIRIEGAHAVSVRSLTLRGFGFALWAGGGTKLSVERAVLAENLVGAWITEDAELDLRQSLVDVSRAPAIMGDGVIVARGGKATVADTELREVRVAIDAYGQGTRATAKHIVVEERSPEESALVVASQGAEVTIEDSRLEAEARFLGAAQAIDPREPKKSAPASLRIARSELVRTLPTNASGFDVHGGSSLALEDSTLATRARVGISSDDAAKLSILRSVIRPVDRRDPSRGEVGAAVVINDGVTLDLDRSAIIGSAQSAILASRGCRVRLAGSLVTGTWEFERTGFDERMASGQAISLSGDAVLDLRDSALVDNAGAAVWMGGDDASVTMKRATIAVTRDVGAVAGLVAWGGTLDVEESLFHGIPDTALALGSPSGVVAGTIVSRSAVAFRMMGDTRVVRAEDEARRPGAGEVVVRDNVLVETDAAEIEEALARGECRCSGSHATE